LNSTRPAVVFTALFGVFLGLALLKFGNPPIMERWVEAPTNIYEFVLGSPWPIAWAYRFLGLLAVLGLVVAVRGTSNHLCGPVWLIVLPLVWLVCQVVAAASTVDDQLSSPTLAHFTACVICFYLGLFSLARVSNPAPFWVGLFLAFLLVLFIGWEQHFGGLEATRQYFFREIYPHLKEVSPEYLKKISSNRIFSTLFYPNSLAAALLLLLPVMLMLVGSARRLLTVPARCLMAGLVAVGALGCLFWSGSKGGLLLMLLLGLTALMRLPFQKRLKLAILAGVLVAGLSLFFCRYLGFFQKGATSVSARFDYWDAALKTAASKPLCGTGPGTFSIPYKAIKRPESEMTRLVHNDYLEQASDSGWLGFGAYTLFVIASLGFGLKAALNEASAGTVSLEEARTHATRSDDSSGPTRPSLANPGPANPWWGFSIWLGVFGWALHGVFDFVLYIPGLAWPAFTFLGLLLGRTRIPSTNPQVTHNLKPRHENSVPQRA
jgi:O-antigen ligase